MATSDARARYRNVTSLDVMRIDRRERIWADRRVPRIDTSRSEIMAALDDIREMLEIFRPMQRQALSLMDDYRRETAEVARLSQEVASLQATLAAGRQELSAVNHSSADGTVTRRAIAELGAIGDETARAAGDILGAAEVIAAEARRLKQGRGVDSAALAETIMGQLVKLYEACNYQDLTQQRVVKIRQLIEGLGQRLEDLADVMSEPGRAAPMGRIAANDAGLINGPALSGETGRLKQREIDGYFD